MCLAIPARITTLHGENMATVEIGGVEREVSLALVDADVGDYVIVHVGIAISTLDENEAMKTLALFAELDEAQDGPPV
jgi:hydrogenase expression/formation protein HypC